MEVLSKIPDLLISFIKEQAPKVLDWYKSLPPKGKAGAFSALIFFLVLATYLVASRERIEEFYNDIHPWIAAGDDRLQLTAKERKIIEDTDSFLSENLKKSLAANLDGPSIEADKDDRYSPWVLAEIITALSTDIAGQKAIENRRDDIAKYFRDPRRLDIRCDCWTQYPSKKDGAQHVLITAWVIYSMEVAQIKPREEEVEFLSQTQDDRGWWNMYYSQSHPEATKRPDGSSFTTSWALLALNQVLGDEAFFRASSKIALKDDLAERRRTAINYFLKEEDNRDRKYQLWSLFPGWRLKPEVSLGTSGLILFSLHRAISNLSERDREQYADELKAVDRRYLDALPIDPDRFPNLWDGDEYSYGLDYQPILNHLKNYSSSLPQQGELSEESGGANSFTLPWEIIGAQVAYKSGNYMERVHAQRFISIAIKHIDSDLNGARAQASWEQPEILLALRYLEDSRLLKE